MGLVKLSALLGAICLSLIWSLLSQMLGLVQMLLQGYEHTLASPCPEIVFLERP